MKKSKLLLSLAMMCLSIAVLCFGVLAATSVTYSISGTISYTVTDVFVKINTSVYGIAEQQSKADVITTVKAMESVSQANTLTINSKTYTRTQTMVEYDSSSATTDPATHTAQTSDSKGVEIVYGTYYTYYIVINIQNLSSSKTVDAIITDNTNAEINSIKTTNLYLNNVEYGTPKNIVIAYSIKDKTSSVDSAAISYSLKVSYEDTNYADPITLESDTKGYYLTLGTGKSVDNMGNVTTNDTNIKWRLVSLDGISKYTYNSSDAFEARYLSDAVFVQETLVGSTLAFNSNNDRNYYNSTIRNGITDQGALKDGSYFNLTSTSLSFIKDRYLGEKLYGKMSSGSGLTYVERPINDKTKDKFWLLGDDEVEKYYSVVQMNIKIETGRSFWLRSPSGEASVWAYYFVGMGSSRNSTDTSARVLAAFQLA